MNRRTWGLIGGTVVLLGIGLVALGQFQDEQTVRYVEDVLADPVAHQEGTFTLLAIPQPAQVPLHGDKGLVMAPNPQHENATRHTTAWRDAAGTVWHSTRTTTVGPTEDGLAWRSTNTTRAPYGGQEQEPTETTWHTGPGHAFPVQAFDDGDGHSPRVWAFIPGPVGQELQVKPSQFTGRLLTHDRAGTPLPAGVLVWTVDEYVAGCSSKFLPPEQADATQAQDEVVPPHRQDEHNP